MKMTINVCDVDTHTERNLSVMWTHNTEGNLSVMWTHNTERNLSVMCTHNTEGNLSVMWTHNTERNLFPRFSPMTQQQLLTLWCRTSHSNSLQCDAENINPFQSSFSANCIPAEKQKEYNLRYLLAKVRT